MSRKIEVREGHKWVDGLGIREEKRHRISRPFELAAQVVALLLVPRALKEEMTHRFNNETRTV